MPFRNSEWLTSCVNFVVSWFWGKVCGKVRSCVETKENWLSSPSNCPWGACNTILKQNLFWYKLIPFLKLCKKMCLSGPAIKLCENLFDLFDATDKYLFSIVRNWGRKKIRLIVKFVLAQIRFSFSRRLTRIYHTLEFFVQKFFIFSFFCRRLSQVFTKQALVLRLFSFVKRLARICHIVDLWF